MRFWDSSALIPLLVSESTSERIKDLLRREPGMAVWWATPVECASALVRRLRAAAALEGFTVMPYSDEINEPEIEAEDWYR